MKKPLKHNVAPDAFVDIIFTDAQLRTLERKAQERLESHDWSNMFEESIAPLDGHRMGVRGEGALTQYMGWGIDAVEGAMPDGDPGWDFRMKGGYKIDAKMCAGRYEFGNLVRLNVKQHADAYVLVWPGAGDNVATLVGGMKSEEFEYWMAKMPTGTGWRAPWQACWPMATMKAWIERRYAGGLA